MPHATTLNSGLHVLPGAYGRADSGELSQVLHGTSAQIDRLRQRALRLARSDARAIHICGESGCGKERLAQALHLAGPQANQLMLVADLRVLGDGAPARVRSCLERIKGEVGTLFLRHPAAASSKAQNQLTSALEDARAASREGARVVTSSSIDLRGHGLQPHFAAAIDLEIYAPVVVPPLRDRTEDLPELCTAILRDLCAQLGQHSVGISPPALAQLKRWNFRGNVAELVSLLRAALCRATSPWITTECLPPPPASGREDRSKARAEFSVHLPGHSLHEIEGKAIACALAAGGGRVVRTAEILGITRHALRRKLAKHGLTATEPDESAAPLASSSGAPADAPRAGSRGPSKPRKG